MLRIMFDLPRSLICILYLGFIAAHKSFIRHQIMYIRKHQYQKKGKKKYTGDY